MAILVAMEYSLAESEEEVMQVWHRQLRAYGASWKRVRKSELSWIDVRQLAQTHMGNGTSFFSFLPLHS